MTGLYIAEVVLVTAAAVGMFWLRRESDRAWRLHCALQPIRANWVQVQIVVRDRLTPALRQMSMELAQMAPAMRRVTEAMKKVTDA